MATVRAVPGCISPRRVLNLIEHLPDTSNFAAYSRFEQLKYPRPVGPEKVTWRDFKGWGRDRELLAETNDRLQLLQITYVASKQKKGKTAPPFNPTERPGEKYRKARAMFDKMFSLTKKGG